MLLRSRFKSLQPGSQKLTALILVLSFRVISQKFRYIYIASGFHFWLTFNPSCRFPDDLHVMLTYKHGIQRPLLPTFCFYHVKKRKGKKALSLFYYFFLYPNILPVITSLQTVKVTLTTQGFFFYWESQWKFFKHQICMQSDTAIIYLHSYVIKVLLSSY